MTYHHHHRRDYEHPEALLAEAMTEARGTVTRLRDAAPALDLGLRAVARAVAALCEGRCLLQPEFAEPLDTLIDGLDREIDVGTRRVSRAVLRGSGPDGDVYETETGMEMDDRALALAPIRDAELRGRNWLTLSNRPMPARQPSTLIKEPLGVPGHDLRTAIADLMRRVDPAEAARMIAGVLGHRDLRTGEEYRASCAGDAAAREWTKMRAEIGGEVGAVRGTGWPLAIVDARRLGGDFRPDRHGPKSSSWEVAIVATPGRPRRGAHET